MSGRECAKTGGEARGAHGEEAINQMALPRDR